MRVDSDDHAVSGEHVLWCSFLCVAGRLTQRGAVNETVPVPERLRMPWPRRTIGCELTTQLTIAEQLLPGWLVSLHDTAVRRGKEPVGIVLTVANSDHVIEQVRTADADLGSLKAPGCPTAYTAASSRTTNSYWSWVPIIRGPAAERRSLSPSSIAPR